MQRKSSVIKKHRERVVTDYVLDVRISLDEKDRALGEYIKQEADRNRRSYAQQVIFMCTFAAAQEARS